MSCGLRRGLMAVALGTMILPQALQADRLLIDVLGEERFSGLPRNGESMQQVERRHGPPRERVQPVGDPPISRWIYDRYTVYFEHDRVLHTVPER